LKFCVTKQEAAISEQLISTMFGLPMMCFVEGGAVGQLHQSGIDDFWSRLDDAAQHVRAVTCLGYFGLNEEIPLSRITKLDQKQFVHCLVVPAINLTPGLMQIPFPIRKDHGGIDWKPVEAIESHPYDGPVYSLDVAEHHKYVQDGMVTCNSIVGIGPVISSGLLANIDITRAPTAGHIWRFAGLDPTCKWAKGEKRPWNASLKRLCWLIGESFVKVSSNPKDIYGKVYLERKEYERKRNDGGQLADQAHQRIAKDKGARRKIDPELLAMLEGGRLPAKALHERAKRYAVKLFLAHWFEEAYRQHYGTEPPKPYAIAHLGHAHAIGAK